MLKLDKNTIARFEAEGIKKIKIFFYNAGCSGTKIDITSEFSPFDVVLIATNASFEVYVDTHEQEKFIDCSITMLLPKANQDNPHLAWNKVKYIYASDKVIERCGCWTSFGFSKKAPKFHLENLKNLGKNFKS